MSEPSLRDTEIRPYLLPDYLVRDMLNRLDDHLRGVSESGLDYVARNLYRQDARLAVSDLQRVAAHIAALAAAQERKA